MFCFVFMFCLDISLLLSCRVCYVSSCLILPCPFFSTSLFLFPYVVYACGPTKAIGFIKTIMVTVEEEVPGFEAYLKTLTVKQLKHLLNVKKVEIPTPMEKPTLLRLINENIGLVLSCLVLSCLVWSCLVLSCLVLSCPV
jgi:hypothetical protein